MFRPSYAVTWGLWVCKATVQASPELVRVSLWLLFLGPYLFIVMFFIPAPPLVHVHVFYYWPAPHHNVSARKPQCLAEFFHTLQIFWVDEWMKRSSTIHQRYLSYTLFRKSYLKTYFSPTSKNENCVIQREGLPLFILCPSCRNLVELCLSKWTLHSQMRAWPCVVPDNWSSSSSLPFPLQCFLGHHLHPANQMEPLDLLDDYLKQ